ncbi:nitroreductase family deazaflavin-dependent oxidoreductase [Ornithinimicrobium faecis]|uniref:Nitroreductase family deazaflavin-dependent oxidoreductase n=1 Tax=Ornithinimicrobium faecis TaxID=2934158 RepID=A0ABY4YYZ4_9MICO|nr:nitroreductase family deazaflavin-dependent oxidoreductase [Ornithinimicrobium sp. HY1793]USQ82001.1 nitroreductase family deazaflavin-dependent oxidoreductase [Ornithinimicrobium sp. HY1793]
MTETTADRDNYVQPATSWVRNQLDAIDEAGGDSSAAKVQGRDVVVVTVIGAKSGRPRRVPLMRVEHDGNYLAVASHGGAPTHPQWTASIRKNPDQVSVLDGTTETAMTSRELSGQEREIWWERGVAAFPSYADYQTKTERLIPIFLLEPR